MQYIQALHRRTSKYPRSAHREMDQAVFLLSRCGVMFSKMQLILVNVLCTNKMALLPNANPNPKLIMK